MSFFEHSETLPAWADGIPEEWDHDWLKWSVCLSTEKPKEEEKETLPYISNEDIASWTGKLLNENPQPTEAEGRKFLVDDVLFNKLRPYLAKVYHAEFTGVCSGELLCLRASGNVFPRYLFYVLASKGFIDTVDSETFGTKMPRADWEIVGHQPLPLPPLETQRRIARFLDDKTARIDGLIEKKRALLDRLAEKRLALITGAVTKGVDSIYFSDHEEAQPCSVVERVGDKEILSWETWKLSHAYTRIGSGTTPTSTIENYYSNQEGIPWITTTELRENYIEKTASKVTTEALDHFSTLRVYKAGALMIAMYGATIGRLGITTVPATCNQACCVFEESQQFDNRFLFYWLWHRRADLIALSAGGGQPNLSQQDLREERALCPPLQTQRRIAQFLDEQTAHINQQVEQIEDSISLLNEYRSALITAAVTGQIGGLR